MPIKKSNTHNSTQKKKAASSRSSARAQKASSAKLTGAKKNASKRSKAAGKSKKSKTTTERPAWLKKRDELTLKIFQMAYDDYQQGKFQRL